MSAFPRCLYGRSSSAFASPRAKSTRRLCCELATSSALVSVPARSAALASPLPPQLESVPPRYIEAARHCEEHAGHLELSLASLHSPWVGSTSPQPEHLLSTRKSAIAPQSLTMCPLKFHCPLAIPSWRAVKAQAGMEPVRLVLPSVPLTAMSSALYEPAPKRAL